MRALGLLLLVCVVSCKSNEATPVAVKQDVTAESDRLRTDRTVLLEGPITEESAIVVIAKLLFLEDADPGKDVRLQINSPGGGGASAFAIYETLRGLKPQVVTLCLGEASGTAALLLSAGTKGKRLAIRDARISLFAGGEDFAKAIAKQTGQPLARVTDDCARSAAFGAPEALEYGLVDSLVFKPKLTRTAP